MYKSELLNSYHAFQPFSGSINILAHLKPVV